MSRDLWSGRIQEPMDAALRRFSSSLRFDRRLVREDLRVSRAHAQTLADAGLLPEPDRGTLLAALDRIEAEVEASSFPPAADGQEAPEDIHSAIEGRLVELCGPAGQRLHAGRSRNDQVATATLLWLKGALGGVVLAIDDLETALVEKAEAHRDLVGFAYTHLQRAMPVLVAHVLLAHLEGLERDRERLLDALRRADRSPLGAGACVGSSLPLDREASARRLGFARVALNSLDATADRDWALEAVSALAILMSHLSRLAEELVLGASAEFGTVRLGDAWSTGSSMMPQKRNPDVAELVRGKSGRVLGALVTLHAVLKGLPFGYNRDLQEDKEPLFDAVETATDCLRLLAGALRSAELRAPRAAGPDFSAATDLAEELVRRGLPFRQAHEKVARLVSLLERDGRGLAQATAEELAEARLEGLDPALLTPRGSIEARRTAGSTAPAEVARALAAARARLAGRAR